MFHLQSIDEQKGEETRDFKTLTHLMNYKRVLTEKQFLWEDLTIVARFKSKSDVSIKLTMNRKRSTKEEFLPL